MLQHNNEVNIAVVHSSNQTSVQHSIINSNEDSSVSNSDLLGIWYHDDDLSKDIQFEMENCLNSVFTYDRIFNNLREFVAYLSGPLLVETKILIITSKFAENLWRIATKRPYFERVYQFQPNSSSANSLTVFTDIDKLFIQISEDIEAYWNRHQSSSTTSIKCRKSILPPPWSLWNNKTTDKLFECCRKESPKFFLFQVSTRILTQKKCDHDRSFAEMIEAYHLAYFNNKAQSQKIDMFQANYDSNNAIWYYTQDSFLFRSLGRAFQSEDLEHIFKFRPYIFDLHGKIDKLAKQRDTLQKIPPLYRGKKLRTTVLQQLHDNIGALISMNGFLSTTLNLQLALVFAGTEQNRAGYESVLFELWIDAGTITKVYADVSSFSAFPSEEEVLFTIGSIWRINSVRKNDDLYWIVTLSSCNDVDSRILEFFEEVSDDSALLMLGDVFLELGQDTKAENFYYKMLNESPINNETRATLYYNIAMINIKKGTYSTALRNLQEAMKVISVKKINTESLTSQSSDLHNFVASPTPILNNIALLYQKKGDLKGASEYFIKALNEETSDPIEKATVYDNIGLLFNSQENYEDALKHFSEAVKLAQDHSSLPKFKQHYDAVNEHLLSRHIPLGKTN